MRMKIIRGVLLLTLLAFARLLFAQDDYGPLSNLRFVVVKDYNGKPIRNAAVVLHPVNKNGKQEKGGLELKTNLEGKAGYDGVPYGKLRIQTLAPGFQTFGQDYEIDKPEMAITIRMKRPQQQYSIYTDHQNDKKDSPPPKKDEPGKDEAAR